MGDVHRDRRWASYSAAVLLLLILTAGQAWTAPGVTPSPGRVLAIGDIHGDFKALTGILRDIGLIDQNNHWVGGETTLVQTGDFTDRGPDVRRVMDLLMQLQAEAAEEGGRLEVLIANHEGMNLVDFWRDNSPADYEAFIDDKSEERQAAAYDEYVQSCFDAPYIVGQHWFEYVDQPIGGRFDGENNNFGLVTVEDEPYDDFVEPVTVTNARAPHLTD